MPDEEKTNDDSSSEEESAPVLPAELDPIETDDIRMPMVKPAEEEIELEILPEKDDPPD